MNPGETPTGDLFGTRDRLALLGAALVMLAIVLVSVLVAARTDQDVQDAIRSQDVRALTVDVVTALESAETGQRGFLLTGKETYLDPYTASRQALPSLLDQLDRATQGNREHAADYAALRGIIDRKLIEMAATIQAARAGNMVQALAIVNTDIGQHSMDQARALATHLATAQRGVLLADLGRSRGGARLLVVIDLLALAALAVLAGFVLLGARRYVARLRAAQAALQEANAELSRGSERLEAAVLERTTELTAANEEVQRFAYIVSHDLRAPLLNIIGFTSELEVATRALNGFVSGQLAVTGVPIPREVREASESDLPEAIRFIQSSTAKMDRLIGAILRLSREGRRVLTPERLELAQVIGGVADSVRQLADAAAGEITIGTLPTLVSDRTALEQIFSNVIENALKYRAPGRPPRIRVEGEARGGVVSIRVIDNGRGIAARDLGRVFELFRRAGAQDTPGEGIGLAHVRALARRLGGGIDCTSILGEGSTFIVSLPTVLAHGNETLE